MNARVVAAEQLSRFEVYYGDDLAGDDLAGFAEYLDHDGQRIFFHTEVGEQFGGKGLASKLIRQALRETVDAGLRIVPLCPFVDSFVRKHPDDETYAAAVDPVTEAAVELVRKR